MQHRWCECYDPQAKGLILAGSWVLFPPSCLRGVLFWWLVSPLSVQVVSRDWLEEQRDSFKRGSAQAGSGSQPQTLPSYVLLCSGPGPVLARSCPRLMTAWSCMWLVSEFKIDHFKWRSPGVVGKEAFFFFNKFCLFIVRQDRYLYFIFCFGKFTGFLMSSRFCLLFWLRVLWGFWSPLF